MANTPTESARNLRQHAEELLRVGETIISESTSSEEMEKILHELRVHQIELEMQNEELRRALEELDAMQARYFDLYDLAPIGYLTIGDKRLIRECNLAAAKMFSVARSVLVNEPVRRILPKEDQNIFYQRLKQCAESGAQQEWEMRLARNNGELFWAHLQVTYAQGGEYWITLNDISERKQAEEALYKSESHYRTLFESSLVGVTVIGRDSVFIDANDAFCNMLEYGKEEVIGGMRISDITCPNDTAICIEMLNKLMSNEIKYYSMEKQYVSKSGKIIPTLIYVRGLYNLKGEYVGCTASVLDVTERKVAENEMKNNERRMTSLFDISQYPFTSEKEFLEHALNEAVTLTASSIGYIYLYNEQKRQFTLNTWSKDVRMECSVVDHRMFDLDIAGIWGEAVRQRKPIMLNDFKTHNPQKKGTPEGHVPLTRFLTAPVMIDGAIVAVVGVANNESEYNAADVMQLALFMDSVWKITAYKRAEEEKLVLEKQFQQTQKLESLGVLAGGIAHDFNNILTVIICNCSLLQQRPQMAEELVPEIEAAAHRAADLCRQMLIYAGKAQPVSTRVNMAALVDEMAKMLKASINKNVIIKLLPSADIPPVTADASQIRQIVMNLIINASEAIGAAPGEIRVSLVHTAVRGEDSVKDYLGNVITPGWYVCLEVEDNGCGMNEETKRRIFEPFYTTKFTGRGLGMSAVLGIIKAHNGALQLESQSGLGTTFKVYLPIEISESPGDKSLPDIPQAPWKGSGTILLVDDEPQLIMVAKMLLNALGFSVIEAINGKEALELYQKNSEQITLVMTDIGMPVMNGYELFRELKKLNSKLPIILSSGFGDAGVTSEIPREDMAEILSKPYNFDQLQEVLKMVVK
jgi:PAS domain S-box-containing protein